MILLSSQGEVVRDRLILTPFNPALQTELPLPLITLNISSRFQASITIVADGARDVPYELEVVDFGTKGSWRCIGIVEGAAGGGGGCDSRLNVK